LWKKHFDHKSGLIPGDKENMNAMKGKNIFLAHGMADISVNYARTEEYSKKIVDI
jgi:predicted esterase